MKKYSFMLVVCGIGVGAYACEGDYGEGTPPNGGGSSSSAGEAGMAGASVAGEQAGGASSAGESGQGVAGTTDTGGTGGTSSMVGCTKDTDCKGNRICVKSACHDPTSVGGSASNVGGAAGEGGAGGVAGSGSVVTPECGKDTDCKGDRICEDGACQDPSSGGTAGSGGTSGTGGSGGGPPATDDAISFSLGNVPGVKKITLYAALGDPDSGEMTSGLKVVCSAAGTDAGTFVKSGTRYTCADLLPVPPGLVRVFNLQVLGTSASEFPNGLSEQWACYGYGLDCQDSSCFRDYVIMTSDGTKLSAKVDGRTNSGGGCNYWAK